MSTERDEWQDAVDSLCRADLSISVVWDNIREDYKRSRGVYPDEDSLDGAIDFHAFMHL